MATPRRYWRINITSNYGDSTTNCEALAFFDGAGVKKTITGNGSASASSNNGSDTISGAFLNTSRWRTDTGDMPCWAQWDFASNPSDITSYSIKNSVDPAEAVRSIKNHKLSWSDDAVNWTDSDIGSQVNGNGVGANTQYFVLSSASLNLISGYPSLRSYSGASANVGIQVQGMVSCGSGAEVFLSSPAASISIRTGISAGISAPIMRISSSGHNSSGENEARLTCTFSEVNSFGGSSSTIQVPSASLLSSATVQSVGTVSARLPTPLFSSVGRASTGGFANINLPLVASIGFSGAVASVTLNNGVSVVASGIVGPIGWCSVDLPLFSISANGHNGAFGEAILTAPSARLVHGAVAYLIAPGFHLTAIGSATVSATYEAYAVNLNHRDPDSNNQVTRYTNYPFDRIVRYKNSYFGMNSTGLYLLEGTTDNATPIPYEVKTHVTDFDATEQKTVVSAYMGGRMGAAETVTLFAGEKTASAYPYTTPRGATPQNYRQKFGRGIKARYYGIGFKGDKEFDLDTLELEINKLPRRI